MMKKRSTQPIKEKSHVLAALKSQKRQQYESTLTLRNYDRVSNLSGMLQIN